MSKQKFSSRGAELPEFDMLSSERLSQIAASERLVFDFRTLSPGKFSFPFHFHRNAEELFYIISGKCSLRTPTGVSEIETGDLIHFESGPSGCHQLHNHTDKPCVYLDIRTFSGIDITEYPDSNKIALLPGIEVFQKESKSSYFKNEEKIAERWKTLPKAVES
ncbi:MAG: cupin domain-containing protein [Candidatus Obscuribacterales bacterium]|nr:cupin domain-containing protein [Candidatus Obscuribacterales bacterium]